MNHTTIFQASAVSLKHRAVLIVGPAGVGKTALCLKLIERGAQLIGDDGVILSVDKGQLCCSAHPNTAGKVEVRGLGIVEQVPFVSQIPVACLIQLHPGKTQRYPQKQKYKFLLGKKIPVFDFYACETDYIQVIYTLKVLNGELSLFKESEC